MTSIQPRDSSSIMTACFGVPRALIGMVHLPALPGAPGNRLDPDTIIEAAVRDARVYRDAGFHALMIENIHDRPYRAGTAGPETVAVMTAVGRALKREVPLPLGVQVLAAANREALAIALACGAQFIRAEAFVYAHVADEGLLQATAGDLMRYRREIAAGHVRVFADIKKKHSSHAITSDLDLVEMAHGADFNLADGVIVTGAATGSEADAAGVNAVARAVTLPVLVGSGISPDNIARYGVAHGFIVGSSVKKDGLWTGELDAARARAVADGFGRLARV